MTSGRAPTDRSGPPARRRGYRNGEGTADVEDPADDHTDDWGDTFRGEGRPFAPVTEVADDADGHLRLAGHVGRPV